MQETKKTAGKTAISLVVIRDCHASHNIVFDDLNENQSHGIRQLAKKHGYHVAERKPKSQEPTCDNCDDMTIIQTRDGNHRHCDNFGFYIPDNEMFPSCDYHSALIKFQKRFSGKSRYENTLKKGGAK